ncbi:MAG: hypothetical protein ACKN85_06395 [Pirellula sp.]
MNHASGFNPPNLDPLDTWLEDLAIPMPLRLSRPKDPALTTLKKSLHEVIETTSPSLDVMTQALLYLRIGSMEPAHSHVQDATRGLGAYIHGVLHRMEQDYWNAKYWFARVNDPELTHFVDVHIRRAATGEGRLIGNWSGPAAFVDMCQSSSDAGRNGQQEHLVQLALWEWQALWEIAKQKNPR